MSGTGGVRKYFEQEAGAFDSIYSEEKSMLWRLLDRRLRKDIYERFRLTLEACGDLTGCSVLDVGCGSGRYAAEYARSGARRVFGIDVSGQMIGLASEYVKAHGYADRCDFERVDFMDKEFGERFDFGVSMGVLDYVADPVGFLNKLLSLSDRKVVVSFPAQAFLRSSQRLIRYRLRGCPLYIYTRAGIEDVIKKGPADLCRSYSIHKIPGWGYDFVVTFEK